MFYKASSFNADFSKWDVSRVIEMGNMFAFASSFNRTLCAKWATSTANKEKMFDGSPGKICTSAKTTTTLTTTTTPPTTAGLATTASSTNTTTTTTTSETNT